MNLNNIFKKELTLSNPLKRKILFIAISFYSLAAVIFVFGCGVRHWVTDGYIDEKIRFSENYAFGKGVNPYKIMLGTIPQLDVEIVDYAGTAPYNYVFYYLFL